MNDIKPPCQAPLCGSEGKEADNMKEYWTEHRITLIAFETQFIYQKSPHLKGDKLKPKERNNKLKKKDIEFEGAFLFPGREDAREN